MTRFSRMIAGAALASALLAGAALAQYAAFPANNLSNSAVPVKGAPGGVGAISCVNPSSSTVYVQFFDTIAAVTVGSTMPKFSVGFPASSGGSSVALGVNFVSGIKVAAAQSPTGGTAPYAPINCAVLFQ